MGIERITIERQVTLDELKAFAGKFGQLEKTLSGDALKEAAAQLESANIRVGRVTIEEQVPEEKTDASTIRRMYSEAVSVASMVWESARADSKPDPTAAQSMIDGLAQAVVQNRSALMALTALKDYDNYTFTHMVNVSILTMAQARGLGIDGPLLREFGLAALMHDIGKVKTPTEILNKPDKLTDEEFAIMKRHVVDGAEILRGTPEIPSLAPIVAFEHHLRIDGTGYPHGVTRPHLNLATMLCGIADVYDAMRSQRKYQQAFPSERILAVLQRNDGKQFDQHLVRRFVQLLGIYPVGNLVKLDTGEVAIVLQVHAPDPYRPKVRVLFAADGARLELPRDINLWETEQDGREDRAVVRHGSAESRRLRNRPAVVHLIAVILVGRLRPHLRLKEYPCRAFATSFPVRPLRLCCLSAARGSRVRLLSRTVDRLRSRRPKRPLPAALDRVDTMLTGGQLDISGLHDDTMMPGRAHRASRTVSRRAAGLRRTGRAPDGWPRDRQRDGTALRGARHRRQSVDRARARERGAPLPPPARARTSRERRRWAFSLSKAAIASSIA